jgi:hypothetical protein
MTARELELYRKCVKKKSKRRTREQFEEITEYNNSVNDNDYDR